MFVNEDFSFFLPFFFFCLFGLIYFLRKFLFINTYISFHNWNVSTNKERMKFLKHNCTISHFWHGLRHCLISSLGGKNCNFSFIIQFYDMQVHRLGEDARRQSVSPASFSDLLEQYNSCVSHQRVILLTTGYLAATNSQQTNHEQK